MGGYDLTPDEREIEEHATELESVSSEERSEIESIIEHARKNRPVNLRMSELDLELIKKRAEAEGLPSKWWTERSSAKSWPKLAT